MKLLQATGRYYLWSSILIFVLGGGILFLALRYVIDIETDERLIDAKATLQFQLSAMDSLPSVIIISDDVIEISLLPGMSAYDSAYEVFSDTLLLDVVERELEPFRKFTYHELVNGRPYRIDVSHSTLDNEALVVTIVLTVLGILGLLLLAVNLVNRYWSLRVWRPFYQAIQQIKGFTFDKGEPLTSPPSNIEEFEVLHHALELMTAKVLSDYRSLKQFTENASHEIQTPLAIIKSKIELLMQREGRDENERQAIQHIQEAASRLSKLNNSLLMLARIENRQYSNARQLNLKQLIEEKIDQLEPLISDKNLRVKTELADVSQYMDPILAEVLLNNLLVNAIKHNIPDGAIELALGAERLDIRNTGKPLATSPDDLFGRFRKDVDAGPSLGLGLAIVKEICAIYGFGIKYDYQDNWHGLTLSWPR